MRAGAELRRGGRIDRRALLVLGLTWAAQLLVDEAAGVAGGVGADAFALDYVRDRIRAAVDARDLTRINTELGTIQVAVVDEDLALAAAAAGRLRSTLADIRPTT